MANKGPRSNDQPEAPALGLGVWGFVGHWALVISVVDYSHRPHASGLAVFLYVVEALVGGGQEFLGGGVEAVGKRG
jgi:hypothetical protein